MADGELEFEIVPDKSTIEDLDGGEVELSTDGAMDEQLEINEEQREQLDIIRRKTGRLGRIFGPLAVIATGIAALSKIIGNVFDINFSDVRNAIVNTLDSIIDVIKSVIGGALSGPSKAVSNITGLENNEAGSLLGTIAGSPFGLSGMVLGALGGSNQENTSSNNISERDVRILTSRDALLGDSTLKEMQSESSQDFVINGGS